MKTKCSVWWELVRLKAVFDVRSLIEVCYCRDLNSDDYTSEPGRNKTPSGVDQCYYFPFFQFVGFGGAGFG